MNRTKKTFQTILFVWSLIFGLLNTGTAHAFPNKPDEKFWVSNGAIYGIDVGEDGTIYLGGSFDYVGPYTGSAAKLDLTQNSTLTFPKFDGEVKVIIEDPIYKGWYVGGNFNEVDGFPIKNLAYVQSNGSVDKSFTPNPDGEVRALLFTDQGLFVGGAFDHIYNQVRNGFASIFTPSGELLPLELDTTSTGAINTFLLSNKKVYIGGSFSSIQGQARSNLAVFDLASQTLTPFSPAISGIEVLSLALSGSTLYVGGNFSQVGVSPRNNLAAFDATTGVVSLLWNPNINGEVDTLLINGTTLYVGGNFSKIGGVAGATRKNFAALDLATGAPTPFNPAPNGPVFSLLSSANILYIGGEFKTIAGQDIPRFAAFDLATKTPLTAQTRVGGTVQTINDYSGSFFIGGRFNSVGGVARQNLAALDPTTGQATAWNPGTNNTIYTLKSLGTTLYVGGSFTQVSGQTRRSLAAVDTTSAVVTPWNPNVVGTVRTFVIENGLMYIGGNFSMVGGLARALIAQLDLATGTPTAWDFSGTGSEVTVLTIAQDTLYIAQDTLYVGGTFFTLAGKSRANFASIDLALGQLTDWIPAPDGNVTSFAFEGQLSYIGGFFTQIAGTSKTAPATFDRATNTLISFNPSVLFGIRSMDLFNHTLYLGGEITDVNGQNRSGLAALDSSSSLTPLQWNPRLGTSLSANALVHKNLKLYTGGGGPGFAAGARNFAVFESGVVEFNQATGQTDHQYQVKNIPVKLSIADADDVMVDYAVTGGTAILGEDFQLTGSSLTIPAGQTQGVLPVTILNNPKATTDRTLELTLSNPKRTFLGAVTKTIYTIQATTSSTTGGTTGSATGSTTGGSTSGTTGGTTGSTAGNGGGGCALSASTAQASSNGVWMIFSLLSAAAIFRVRKNRC